MEIEKANVKEEEREETDSKKWKRRTYNGKTLKDQKLQAAQASKEEQGTPESGMEASSLKDSASSNQPIQNSLSSKGSKKKKKSKKKRFSLERKAPKSKSQTSKSPPSKPVQSLQTNGSKSHFAKQPSSSDKRTEDAGDEEDYKGETSAAGNPRRIGGKILLRDIKKINEYRKDVLERVNKQLEEERIKREEEDQAWSSNRRIIFNSKKKVLEFREVYRRPVNLKESKELVVKECSFKSSLKGSTAFFNSKSVTSGLSMFPLGISPIEHPVESTQDLSDSQLAD